MALKETILLEMKDKEFLHVEGSYTPEEPMVMYYKDGTGHPGTPSEFEIDQIWYETNTGVKINVTRIFDLIYDEEFSSWETFSDKIVNIFEESKE